jgi:hypothetical protein
MKIDELLIQTIDKHQKKLQDSSKLEEKVKKYNQLLKQGYIQKQVYSISRLDTIGYSLYNQFSL